MDPLTGHILEAQGVKSHIARNKGRWLMNDLHSSLSASRTIAPPATPKMAVIRKDLIGKVASAQQPRRIRIIHAMRFRYWLAGELVLH